MSTEKGCPEEASLKLKTARTLKWNTIDRLASQVLYGVVGVVLANVLSQEDFGLVGALLVFQAFAIIFSDSGFGAALLQKKHSTEEDYSTVFWFNLVVSFGIYGILWYAAPYIARIFQNDLRLIPLSKVMFLTFVLNALAIVQTNRLMKRMDVKMIAVSNLVGQMAGGCVGITLAFMGYGAWALVWQSVTLAGVKTGLLWVTGKWLPTCWIKIGSLRGIWRVGFSVFSSSFLNTLFLNVYSFVIGKVYSLRALGVYTQADKWSKMGSASMSQILMASFVPVLSRVQDSAEDYPRYVRKINRFTGFVLFPAMIGLAAIGGNLFHVLFGSKWDAAILLFQILTIRGIFVVLVSLYSNYMLAKGYSKRLVTIEVIKDVAIALAILATVWDGSVDLLVWGQLWASVLTWGIVIVMVARAIDYGVRRMLGDLVPFLLLALSMGAACIATDLLLHEIMSPRATLTVMSEDTSWIDRVDDNSLLGIPDHGAEVGVSDLTAEVAISDYGDEVGISDFSSSVGINDNNSVVGMSNSDRGVGMSDNKSGVDMCINRFYEGIILIIQLIVGVGVYVGLAKMMRFPELGEATGYLFGRFRKNR